MNCGQVLRVIDSGLDSGADIESLCREAGHELISTACTNGFCAFLIRKH